MTSTRITYEERAAQRRRNRQIANWIRGACFLLFAGLVVLMLVPVISGYFEKRDVYTVVNSKERVCDGSGSNGHVDCKYLVFTEAGTFKITDALFGTVRFNSSDVYGRIKADHCYHLRVYGWRMPAFSSYPNISSLEEISCPPVAPTSK